MLNDDEINIYRKTGCLVKRNFISQDSILLINNEIKALECLETQNPDFYYEKSHRNQSLLRRVEKISDYSATIKSLLNSTLIQGALQRISGKNQILFKDKLNFKPPLSKGFRAHVDGHFYWKDKDNVSKRGWLNYADNFINIVFPIDFCTIDNGCLYIAYLDQVENILGTNWSAITDKLESLGPYISLSEIKQFSFFPLEINPGDVVFFDWRLPHYSPDNKSKNHRRIFYATYHDAEYGNNRQRYYKDKSDSKNTKEQKALI